MQDPSHEVEIVERPETELQTTTSTSADALIQQAIQKGLPVETMERLLAMRKELKAEAAKEAFDAAMAKFQSEIPVIEKKKEAKDGLKVLYKYAPLDSIVSQVQEALGNNGLSYFIRTEMTPTHVKVTCVVKHRLGHAEESTIEMPMATRTGIMSAPQQVASTVTFAKRYAFQNALGIMTGDEDTDAATVETPPAPAHATRAETSTPADKMTIRNPDEPATEPQLRALAINRQRYGIPEEVFKASYKINSTKELTKGQASKAIDELKKRADRGEHWVDPSLPSVQIDDDQTYDDTGIDTSKPPSEAESVHTGAPWDKWKRGELSEEAKNIGSA